MKEYNAKAIKKYRLSKGLSVAQLAKEMGISRTVAYRYESGENIPTPKRLMQIAEFLGVDPLELLGD